VLINMNSARVPKLPDARRVTGSTSFLKEPFKEEVKLKLTFELQKVVEKHS